MDKKCFVIMPFSKTVEGHDEKYWSDFFCVIKKIMDENGYSCTRSEVGPYKLFLNIIRNIENSDVVIAVLTDFNSNVWYELGIRHTIRTGTIMLLQEGQKRPFDVSDFGIIFYNDSVGFEHRMQKSIKDYLEKLENNDCDSPVISTLNSRECTNVEKELGELKKLVWKLIDEMPRDNIIRGKAKIRINRILWVDDYPTNNKSVINLFEDKGIQFDLAITTKQGLEFCKRQMYDLIITDMGRGNESDAGLSLIKGLKLQDCQIPIIVYASCRAINRYGDEAIRLGAYKVTNEVGDIISLISDILE